MLCPGPTIWHFPPPSSFLSPPSIFAYLLLVPSLCPSTTLLHHSPLTSLSALSLSRCISVSLSRQHCVTGRPAELTWSNRTHEDGNRNKTSQHDLPHSELCILHYTVSTGGKMSPENIVLSSLHHDVVSLQALPTRPDPPSPAEPVD